MGILQLLMKGGIVMIPILLCSIVGFAIFFERLSVFKSTRETMKETFDEALQGERRREHVMDILESKSNQIVGLLGNHMNYLEGIITISPLLGLLGTVTGMIQAFKVLDTQAGEPLAITAGVSEALIATAAGLCVAIIALILHTLLSQKEEKIIQQMELYIDNTVQALARGRHES